MTVTNEQNPLIHIFDFYMKRLGVPVVVAITGNDLMKSGVGKSYTGLRIAEMMDPDYRTGTGAMDKIVFTPKDFIRAMDVIEKKGKRGQVLLIDEAGLLIDSRRWYSLINKAVGDVVMTFRTLRCMAIFVTPAMDVVDRRIRMFFNFQMIAEKVYRGGGPKVRVRVYGLRWVDDVRGKPMWRKLATYNRDKHMVIKHTKFWVDYPHNKELVAAYEEKSQLYKKTLRASIADLEERDMTEKVLDINEVVKKVLARPEMIETNSKGRRKVNQDDIAFTFEIDKREAGVVSRKVNRELNKELLQNV